MKVLYVLVLLLFCLENGFSFWAYAETSDLEKAEELLDQAVQMDQKKDYAASEKLYKQIKEKYGKLKRQIEDDSGDEDIQNGESFGDIASRQLPFITCKKEGISKRRFSDIDKFVKDLLAALNSMHATSVAKLVDCESVVTSNNVSKPSPSLPNQLAEWLISQRRKEKKGAVLPVSVFNKYSSEYLYLIGLEKFRDYPQLIIVLEKNDQSWAWTEVYTNSWKEVFSGKENDPQVKIRGPDIDEIWRRNQENNAK